MQASTRVLYAPFHMVTNQSGKSRQCWNADTCWPVEDQRVKVALGPPLPFSAACGRGRTPRSLHSKSATLRRMKSAQLPPVRVEPAVRDEIESVLREGESLSQFVEAAAVQAARQRKAQDEFLARGRSSLAKAKRTGEFHDLAPALDAMQDRLVRRLRAVRPAAQAAKGVTRRK